MVEFNPDGSLKLPGVIAQAKLENERKMRTKRCISIKKEITNFSAPKTCVLHINLSNVIKDAGFINTIFQRFKQNSSVPCSLSVTEDCGIDIEIGSDFRRCTGCCSLVDEYREFVEVLEDKGNCQYEGRKTFSYDDYFD